MWMVMGGVFGYWKYNDGGIVSILCDYLIKTLHGLGGTYL